MGESSVASYRTFSNGIMYSIEPLAKVLPFMVRYLTTNGESAVCNPTPPFALRYRRARREFCKRLKIDLQKPRVAHYAPNDTQEKSFSQYDLTTSLERG